MAEKFHAMVYLGLPNSRMKDFFDVWFLSREFSYDGVSLTHAVKSTFDRRRTALPDEIPLALSTTFTGDPAKQTQWRAFLKRSRVAGASVTLAVVVETLGPFPASVLDAARGGQVLSAWPPGGPWTATHPKTNAKG